MSHRKIDSELPHVSDNDFKLIIVYNIVHNIFALIQPVSVTLTAQYLYLFSFAGMRMEHRKAVVVYVHGI